MKLTTLQDYVNDAKRNYDHHHTANYNIPFVEEELIWAIQDYHSMRGELTASDYAFLYAEYGFRRESVDTILNID